MRRPSGRRNCGRRFPSTRINKGLAGRSDLELLGRDLKAAEDNAAGLGPRYDSIVKPLRWPHVVSSLEQLGVRKLWVAGPDTLFGRVRAITSRFEVVTVNPRLALQPRRRGAGPSRVS